MQARAFATVGGIVFALVSLAHLLRLIFTLEVTIGTYVVPMWISGGGFVVGSMLAIWACFIVIGGSGESS